MGVFQTIVGRTGFSGGVNLATDSALLDGKSSPNGLNSALALVNAGHPYPQKRRGISVINTTPFTSSPSFIGQYDYFKVSSGVHKHLLVTSNGKLTINNGDGTFTNLGTTPLTVSGNFFPDFETASDLCFIVDGALQVKTDGATVTNFGITRPTVGTMAGAAGAAGVHNGTYELRVTYANSSTGHESSASNTATATVVVANQQINWTNIPVSGDAQVDTRYLYVRNVATQGQFFRAGTIANNSSTTATTNISDANLTIAAPLIDGRERPPAGTRFVCYHQGRMFIATTNELRWSLIGAPEAFDARAADDVNGSDGQEITGLHSEHGVLMIFKTDRLYTLSGDDPDLWTISLQDGDRGCLSHRTIVSAHGGTWFWSRHGAAKWEGAGFCDPLGERTFGSPVDAVDASAITTASALYHEVENRVLFAVPDNGESRATRIIPFNAELGILESSQWDPMDCASLGYARDANSIYQPFLGNYLGQLFKLWEGDNDGVLTDTTSTGSFVAASDTISSITDSGATFDTTGGKLLERKVTLVDATGLPMTAMVRPRITANTGTTLTLDRNIAGLVIGNTYTYYVGGPNFEWSLPWQDDRNPFIKKRFEYFFIVTKGVGFGSTGSVEIDLDYDEFDVLGKAKFIIVPYSTSQWDVSRWDVDVWDSLGNKEYRFRMARTGKVWRAKIVNRAANQPFAFLEVGMQGVSQTGKA